LLGLIRSRPAGFQGVSYAATNAGEVIAVADANRAAWPIRGGRFRTGRAVLADLFVDEYGVFVAGTDSVLYVLDRGTGRIRWRFMAQAALESPPLVTGDRVYQVVPGAGLAALNKLEGGEYRSPIWTTPGVSRVLSADDRFVYALSTDARLLAVDRDTGKVRFSGGVGEYTRFAAAGSTVYAASDRGTLVAIKPALIGVAPGQVLASGN
jgi:outer membrane protein assembly factor BamB